MSAWNMFMYCLSTIGMCHIIVDGSILQWFRDLVKSISEKLRIPHLGNVVDCYLCCGTWCGFLMGWVWLVSAGDCSTIISWLKIFGCGCAGGFLSNSAAVWLNYLEANTIVSMPEEPTFINTQNTQDDK